jgi:hypothetical protein
LAHLRDHVGVNMVWRNLAYNCGEFLSRDDGIEETAGNYITDLDPGFTDPAHLNFGIKESSPILAGINFRPIPFSEIGLYNDENRASWPVRTTITPHYKAAP